MALSKPESSLEIGTVSNQSRLVAVLGILLYCGFLIGISLGLSGVLRAFDSMASTGTGNAQAFSQRIGEALEPIQYGVALGILGTIVVFVTLLAVKNREIWFYRVCSIISWLNCLVFPLGTICGISVLVVLHRKKAEFQDSRQSDAEQDAALKSDPRAG